MRRDVTLKGGISLTINEGYEGYDELRINLEEAFPDSSIHTRIISSRGVVTGIIIEATDISEEELLAEVSKSIELTSRNHNLERIDSSLGNSFFKQMFKALIVAFLFMGSVFFYYFSENTKSKIFVLLLSITNFFLLRNKDERLFWFVTLAIVSITVYIYVKQNLPTLAALVSALLDIFITIGIMSFLDVRLTAGGIAAYLMMIGYSIDTSILLSTKLLKDSTGDFSKDIFGAMKTGLTMSAAGIATMGISYLFTNNITLKQIMLILVVGLIVDILTTWIGNVTLLKVYLDKQAKVKGQR